MKTNSEFQIGDQVLVTPKSDPMGGHEFMARITDSRHEGTYIVEDQDSDFFEVDADEIKPLDDEDQCSYCGSGLIDDKGNCQKCGL